MIDAKTLPYRLGLPAWAFPGWKDRYWSARPSALSCYAQVFNAVEGNTTFYRVPAASTVDRWRADLAGRDFRICFKLPRTVTHTPRPDRNELEAFLDVIGPLGPQLGPLLLQFPAAVDPPALARFREIFERVSERHRFVIELRHRRFFDEPELAEALIDRYRCGRVMLDTRALYRGDTSHPEVVDALHEKPDVPVLDRVYHGTMFVRLVLHPDPRYNDTVLAEWVERTAARLAAGDDLFMMVHCPNNLHCPGFAERFHALLRQRVPTLAALPPWPLPQQSDLF